MDIGWRDDAACTGHDPEMWFPSTKPMSPQNLEAIQICQGCPVKEPCLIDGMGSEFGIFGGITGPDRSKMRQRQRRLSQRSLGAIDDGDVCRCAGCGGWMLRASGCQLCSKAAHAERTHAA